MCKEGGGGSMWGWGDGWGLRCGGVGGVGLEIGWCVAAGWCVAVELGIIHTCSALRYKPAFVATW